MPLITYVENGDLVGYLPSCGARARVPLSDIMREARAQLSPAELERLSYANGPTVVGAVDDAVGGKIARKLKKAVKKVAKSKIVKAITKVVKKAVPPPFNIAVKAAEGAAKLGKALASKKKTKSAKVAKAKAKKVVPAVRAAARGRITSKQLVKVAKKAGVKPSIAVDAAVIKRVAMDARTNPKAAATLRLAKDLTDTRPAKVARAVEAIEDNEYSEPTTSREGEPSDYEQAPMEASMSDEEQAPMTEDAYGPDAVQPAELEQAPDAEPVDGADDYGADLAEPVDEYPEAVEGYGYY